MSTTRWVWIHEADGTRVLAFVYIDPMAGPSAKGAVVGSPPTPEQIRNAIDHPDRTFRRPEALGAISISAQDALGWGLPKDPPWIGVFENKPLPPPPGKSSRTVTAFVHRGGAPVAGVRVRIGYVHGPERELGKVAERTTDASGSCAVPLAPMPAMTPIAAVAEATGYSSQLVDVSESNTVDLELVALGVLEGEVRQCGAPIAAHVSITGRAGGMYKVKRSDQSGRYRLDGVVPGTYDVEVTGIDPSTRMKAGTPTFDRLIVAAGQTTRRDYALVTGATIHIAAAIANNEPSGNVFLFAGTVAPRTSIELRDLWKSLDQTLWRSSNHSTNDGRHMRCKFTDVTPGTYTVCISPWDCYSNGHAEQPVASQTVLLAGEDITIELAIPAIRLR